VRLQPAQQACSRRLVAVIQVRKECAVLQYERAFADFVREAIEQVGLAPHELGAAFAAGQFHISILARLGQDETAKAPEDAKGAPSFLNLACLASWRFNP